MHRGRFGSHIECYLVWGCYVCAVGISEGTWSYSADLSGFAQFSFEVSPDGPQHSTWVCLCCKEGQRRRGFIERNAQCKRQQGWWQMVVSFRCFREADAFGNTTAVLISVSSCLLRNANLSLKITLSLYPPGPCINQVDNNPISTLDCCSILHYLATGLPCSKWESEISLVSRFGQTLCHII